MPPRVAKLKAEAAEGAFLTPKHKAAAEKSSRLRDQAFGAEVVAKSRRLCSNELPPPKMLIAADGKDIVKKSSARKGRYLLALNCRLAPAVAGKLGELGDLDTKNPVLYFDFPEGRLKCFGTLVFPKNKYMILKFQTKDILCEDVLDTLLVFADAWWIGTKEENPEEKQLPFPAALLGAKRHTNYSFEAGGEEVVTLKRAAGTSSRVRKSEDSDDEDGEDVDGPAPSASQRPKRAARTARSRVTYTIDEGSEDDIEDSGDEEIDKPAAKARKVAPSSCAGAASKPAAAPGTKAGKVEEQDEDTLELDDSDDENDKQLANDDAAGASLKQSTMLQFTKKAAPKPAAKAPKPATSRQPSANSGASRPAAKPAARKPAASSKATSSRKRAASSSDNDSDVEVVSSDDEAAPTASQTSRPSRAAKSAAAKRFKESDDEMETIEEVSEEEEASEESEDDDDDFDG